MVLRVQAMFLPEVRRPEDREYEIVVVDWLCFEWVWFCSEGHMNPDPDDNTVPMGWI